MIYFPYKDLENRILFRFSFFKDKTTLISSVTPITDDFLLLKKLIRNHNLILKIGKLIHERIELNSTVSQSQISFLDSLNFYYRFLICRGIDFFNLTFQEDGLSPKEINYLLIITCFFLSYKSHDFKFTIEDFLKLSIKTNNVKKEQLQLLLSKVRKFERTILEINEFNISRNAGTVYSYLSIFNTYFKDIELNDGLIDTINTLFNKYLNGCIFFPLYLCFTPGEMALACISLIEEKYNLNISLEILISYCKEDQGIDKNEINKCKDLIKNILILEKKYLNQKKDNCDDNNITRIIPFIRTNTGH